MAFITVRMAVLALLLFLLNVSGRVCYGNISDSTHGDSIIRNEKLEIEQGTLRGNDDNTRNSASTTTNECVNEFVSSLSSMNQTNSDIEGKDVPSGTSISSLDDDKVSTTPDSNRPTSMKSRINIGFGAMQVIEHDREATQERLIETLLYMHNNYTLSSASSTATAIQTVPCRMHHELCAYWAARGECEMRPGYMRVQCAPACFSCQDIYFEHRCPMPNKTAAVELNAWQPGDLNRMFEDIVSLHRNNNASDMEYDTKSRPVTILSHPGQNVNGMAAPWVVQIENFVTPDECDTLIQLGTQLGYQRSTGLNMTAGADGTYGNVVENVRTSSNSWCLEECYWNPTTQTVLRRIEQMTRIPDTNSEYLQLLHYDVGQFYKIHHDYIDFHLNRTQGVRLATVFLYLNDVEEGGETNFPELNVTVEAKRGRALIWPSVFDSDPDTMDPLTKHEALPVVKGVKYGANSWIHQRDFKASYKIGCVG